MTKLRGLRGATTADANTKQAILDATSELIAELTARNDLDLDDVAAAFFTTTHDLNAEFPAVAARLSGWTKIALMCGHDMNVPDDQPMCIRVMVLLNTDKRADQLNNVYLKDAVNLRARGVSEG